MEPFYVSVSRETLQDLTMVFGEKEFYSHGEGKQSTGGRQVTVSTYLGHSTSVPYVLSARADQLLLQTVNQRRDEPGEGQASEPVATQSALPVFAPLRG